MKNKLLIQFIFILFLFIFSNKKILAGCSKTGSIDWCCPTITCSCSEDIYNPGMCSCSKDVATGGTCSGGVNCRIDLYACTCDATVCGGCFTPDTPIDTPNGEKQIKDLEVGDEVKSFDEQTGEEQTSLVEKIYETTRSAYYKLVLQDGTEVKVTGEHPLYTIQEDEKPLSFWKYLQTEGLIRKAIDFIGKKI